MANVDDMQILHDFLKIPTPRAWINKAITEVPLILIDHAHCERKAASMALMFMSKYPEKSELVKVMSPLAREELLHFEKVRQLMATRNIQFKALPASTYAKKLHQHTAQSRNLERLRDELIIGAIIEARSCERFHALAPYIEDEELAKFYRSLVKAEARHFHEYLRLARLYFGEIDTRIETLIDIENTYIQSPDPLFRFHSGIPV